MKKETVFDRIANFIDLENEPVVGKPLVEIVDAHSVLVENHCGVIGYDRQCISIKTKSGCIRVSGYGLYLKHMSRCQLRIHGQIEKVELIRR